MKSYIEPKCTVETLENTDIVTASNGKLEKNLGDIWD